METHGLKLVLQINGAACPAGSTAAADVEFWYNAPHIIGNNVCLFALISLTSPNYLLLVYGIAQLLFFFGRATPSVGVDSEDLLIGTDISDFLENPIPNCQ